MCAFRRDRTAGDQPGHALNEALHREKRGVGGLHRDDPGGDGLLDGDGETGECLPDRLREFGFRFGIQVGGREEADQLGLIDGQVDEMVTQGVQAGQGVRLRRFPETVPEVVEAVGEDRGVAMLWASVRYWFRLPSMGIGAATVAFAIGTASSTLG